MTPDLLLRFLSSEREGVDDDDTPHLSDADLDQVLERRVLLGGTSETALQELGLVDEAQALRLLARVYPMPVLDRAAVDAIADDTALRVTLPKRIAESHRLCPVALQGRKLTVLCPAPEALSDVEAALEELGFALSLYLVPTLTTEALHARACHRVYGTPVPSRFQAVLDPISVDVDVDFDMDADASDALGAPKPNAKASAEADAIADATPHPAAFTGLPSITIAEDVVVEAQDHSGWNALQPARMPTVATTPPTPTPIPSPTEPTTTTTSTTTTPALATPESVGWAISPPAGVDVDGVPRPPVLPPHGPGALDRPKLSLVVEGTVPAEPPERLRAHLESLSQEAQALHQRRKQKVLWSVDDAVAELTMADGRDALLEVALRFAYRRLQTAAIFVRQGQGLVAFDVLDPHLEGPELRRFPIPVGDAVPTSVGLPSAPDNALARAFRLKSPAIGPVDANDPLCRLFGRCPRAFVLVPFFIGERAVGAIVGDQGDKEISGEILAELHRLAPHLGRALGALVLRARRSVSSTPAPSTTTTTTTTATTTAPPTTPPKTATVPDPPGRTTPPPLPRRPVPPSVPPAAKAAGPAEVTMPPVAASPQAEVPTPSTTATTATATTAAAPTAAAPTAARAAPDAITLLPQSAPGTRPNVGGVAMVDGDIVVPSPGAQARESLLLATSRAWRATGHDPALEALVTTVSAGGQAAAAAALKLSAAGLIAMPALLRAFPGPIHSDLFALGADEAARRIVDTPLIQTLLRLGPDAVAPIIVGAIDHDERIPRFAAVACARALALPAALPGLLRRVFDDDPALAGLATDALGAMRSDPGYDAALERLRDLSRRGNDDERRAAVRALGALRDAGGLSVLIDLLPVRPRDIAEEARAALVEITRQDFGLAERRWRAWLADHGNEPRHHWLLEALLHRELGLRQAAADDLADDGVGLFGYRADGPVSEREEAVATLRKHLENAPLGADGP